MRFTALPVHSFEDATLDLEQLQALLTLPAWTALALINAWANNGAPFETAGYLKDGLGFVHLKGVITGGASNTVAFTLPAGYRPGATTWQAAASGNGTVAGSIQITTAGAATILFAGANVGLSGITFLAQG